MLKYYFVSVVYQACKILVEAPKKNWSRFFFIPLLLFFSKVQTKCAHILGVN